MLALAGEDGREPFASGAAGASHPSKVLVGVAREIVQHDVVDAGGVEGHPHFSTRNWRRRREIIIKCRKPGANAIKKKSKIKSKYQEAEQQAVSRTSRTTENI